MNPSLFGRPDWGGVGAGIGSIPSSPSSDSDSNSDDESKYHYSSHPNTSSTPLHDLHASWARQRRASVSSSQRQQSLHLSDSARASVSDPSGQASSSASMSVSPEAFRSQPLAGRSSWPPALQEEVEEEAESGKRGTGSGASALSGPSASRKNASSSAHEEPRTPAGRLKGPKRLRPKPLGEVLTRMIDGMKRRDPYGFFLVPVDASQVPGYADVIKQPMDLGTMEKKIQEGAYQTVAQFKADFLLVVNNAQTFNPPSSIYHAEAKKLQSWGLRAIDREGPSAIEPGSERERALQEEASKQEGVKAKGKGKKRKGKDTQVDKGKVKAKDSGASTPQSSAPGSVKSQTPKIGPIRLRVKLPAPTSTATNLPSGQSPSISRVVSRGVSEEVRVKSEPRSDEEQEDEDEESEEEEADEDEYESGDDEGNEEDGDDDEPEVKSETTEPAGSSRGSPAPARARSGSSARPPIKERSPAVIKDTGLKAASKPKPKRKRDELATLPDGSIDPDEPDQDPRTLVPSSPPPVVPQLTSLLRVPSSSIPPTLSAAAFATASEPVEMTSLSYHPTSLPAWRHSTPPPSKSFFSFPYSAAATQLAATQRLTSKSKSKAPPPGAAGADEVVYSDRLASHLDYGLYPSLPAWTGIAHAAQLRSRLRGTGNGAWAGAGSGGVAMTEEQGVARAYEEPELFQDLLKSELRDLSSRAYLASPEAFSSSPPATSTTSATSKTDPETLSSLLAHAPPQAVLRRTQGVQGSKELMELAQGDELAEAYVRSLADFARGARIHGGAGLDGGEEEEEKEKGEGEA